MRRRDKTGEARVARPVHCSFLANLKGEAMTDVLKLGFMLCTKEYRGDHDSDVKLAYDFPLEWTLREVIESLNGLHQSDVLEIRTVKTVGGKP